MLYGTFSNGGGQSGTGLGTVFKIKPTGALTTLHEFSGPDGASPWSGVIQATDGNLYGTTVYGGSGPCAGGVAGCGTVFKVTPGGALTTLYSFCAQANCADGSYPYAGVIQANDGNLYGLTSQGGTGLGTAFKITLEGQLTTLSAWDGSGPFSPEASLVQATDGNFYGTSLGGLFRLAPDGTVTVLYRFTPLDTLIAPLIQATDGNLYGTTEEESHKARNAGTVFRVSLGLAPFVKTQPTSSKIGATVTILGNNLAGATSVTFNGTPATAFTVNSTNSAITTTVPAGATTGSVQVTLPGGVTLSSNVPFRVV